MWGQTQTDPYLVYFQRRQGLVDAVDKLVDVLEMLCHLCGQDHVNDSLAQRPVIIPVSATSERLLQITGPDSTDRDLWTLSVVRGAHPLWLKF